MNSDNSLETTSTNCNSEEKHSNFDSLNSPPSLDDDDYHMINMDIVDSIESFEDNSLIVPSLV